MGIVYSTNPDFRYQTEQEEEETLPNEKQVLRITLDKRNRKGKAVTLISGFRGKACDLESLGKWLRGKCGTGGTVKEGSILIQGDMRQKVFSLLMESRYTGSKLC
ncbi:MAG: translation initiation factor [Tannerellaceae bacterium]|jgi:translation initiation factor 1|nr:translation initiation factor [Tannerellaceae bacterium]